MFVFCCLLMTFSFQHMIFNICYKFLFEASISRLILSISLVICSSSSIIFSMLEMDVITVEWSLPPNFSPISLKCMETVEAETTTKFAFQTEDGYTVEAIIMYHWQDEKYIKNNKFIIISMKLNTNIFFTIFSYLNH